MNKKRILIVNIIVLGMIMFSNVNAQSKTDEKESARVFVQKFYDWYAVVDSSSIASRKNPVASALGQKKECFDVHLRKAIMDDEHAQAKAKGELVGLDFDPFTNAQDTRVGYQTGNVKQIGDKFFVDVHDIAKGKSKEAILAAELVVVAEVSKANGHWVFTNFIYNIKDGNENLLQILKSLAKNRVKRSAKK
ncbi:MAG: hypothetical protein ACHQIM_03815 [Sphingobacteriales bacterium]